MHIAIEGMDGAGKTTLAKVFAKKIGFTFIEKPLHYLFDEKDDAAHPQYMKISARINALSDQSIRARFYGLGNYFLRRGLNIPNIVTDRHLVSNYYWNGDSANEAMFKELIEDIGKPEITFLIFARPEVRYSRIQGRNPEDPDLTEVFSNVDPYAKMEDFLVRYKFNYKKIDTSELDIDQTVDIMLQLLERTFPNIVRNNQK